MKTTIKYSPPPANAAERLRGNPWTPTKEARDRARALVARTMKRIGRNAQ
jgi:hypothetical protein